MYIKEQACLSLSKRMQAGLNRAEVLNVLSALVLLHHIFYKNSSGLALIKVRLFLLRVRDERFF